MTPTADSHRLHELAELAAAVLPNVLDWITRSEGLAQPVRPAVAIAFAARACSTAARGVEQPTQPILLEGVHHTPLRQPLLDAVAATHLARAEIPRPEGALLGWDATVTAALEALPRATAAGGDLASQLRFLVRATEQALYGAAKGLAYASTTDLDESNPVSPLSSNLRAAGAYALAAAALAPEPPASPHLASFTDRYYR